jgi:hypothetical protein
VLVGGEEVTPCLRLIDGVEENSRKLGFKNGRGMIDMNADDC